MSSPIETIAARVLADHGWIQYTNRCICGRRPVGGDMGQHQAAEIARAIAEDKGLREAVAEVIQHADWCCTACCCLCSCGEAAAVIAALTTNREEDR